MGLAVLISSKSVYRSVDRLQISAFSVFEMELPKLHMLNSYIHICFTYVEISLYICIKAYGSRPRDPSRTYVHIPLYRCVESLRDGPRGLMCILLFRYALKA